MGARLTAPVQTGLGAHPAFYTMGTGSFPGVKSDQDVPLTTACKEPQCLYNGAL